MQRGNVLVVVLAGGTRKGQVIGVIAKSRGMTDVAKETGLSRQSLYRALGENGNPELATVVKVRRACGVRLNAEPTRRPPIKSRRVEVA